jgi:hypothetical protein
MHPCSCDDFGAKVRMPFLSTKEFLKLKLMQLAEKYEMSFEI